MKTTYVSRTQLGLCAITGLSLQPQDHLYGSSQLGDANDS
jgi:hypothetical protein